MLLWLLLKPFFCILYFPSTFFLSIRESQLYFSLIKGALFLLPYSEIFPLDFYSVSSTYLPTFSFFPVKQIQLAKLQKAFFIRSSWKDARDIFGCGHKANCHPRSSHQMWWGSIQLGYFKSVSLSYSYTLLPGVLHFVSF